MAVGMRSLTVTGGMAYSYFVSMRIAFIILDDHRKSNFFSNSLEDMLAKLIIGWPWKKTLGRSLFCSIGGSKEYDREPSVIGIFLGTMLFSD